MSTPAQFPSEIAQRILALLEDNSVSLVTEDGMILYGDQSRVPVTPTLCVESGPAARVLAGVGGNGRTENILVCYILLYYAKVDSNQVTKLAAEQCSEAVVRYLDTNPTLARGGDGGIVIHGYVTAVDPGYSFKNKGSDLYYSVRLTWTGKTKTMLGA
jgi:hypothetical protein